MLVHPFSLLHELSYYELLDMCEQIHEMQIANYIDAKNKGSRAPSQSGRDIFIDWHPLRLDNHNFQTQFLEFDERTRNIRVAFKQQFAEYRSFLTDSVDDYPAQISCYGHRFVINWHQKNLDHRDHKPSEIQVHRNHPKAKQFAWKVDNQLHRTTGPAVEFFNEFESCFQRQYYYQGRKIEESWMDRMGITIGEMAEPEIQMAWKLEFFDPDKPEF